MFAFVALATLQAMAPKKVEGYEGADVVPAPSVLPDEKGDKKGDKKKDDKKKDDKTTTLTFDSSLVSSKKELHQKFSYDPHFGESEFNYVNGVSRGFMTMVKEMSDSERKEAMVNLKSEIEKKFYEYEMLELLTGGGTKEKNKTITLKVKFMDNANVDLDIRADDTVNDLRIACCRLVVTEFNVKLVKSNYSKCSVFLGDYDLTKHPSASITGKKLTELGVKIKANDVVTLVIP